ncbi:MAG: HU family DNA-binding protein, partial [Candidatus Omnitrophica bacterium]|nr:HU family DNA-binding protein [Candidatus Omnitrophota bacterium]
FFLTQVESKEIIKFILARVTKDLKKGERVYFRDFGSFVKEKRKSKKVRHPKTGKIITIPEKTIVDFTPSEALINKIISMHRSASLSFGKKLPKRIRENI